MTTRNSQLATRTPLPATGNSQLATPKSCFCILHSAFCIRKGFTLVEVLIAVGIMVVLAGMLFVGIEHMGNSARARTTKVTLQNAAGLLEELRIATKLPRIPSQWQWGGNGSNYLATGGGDFWLNPQPTATPLYAPGSVNAPQDSNTGDRYVSDAVQNTVIAMQQIIAMPVNRSAIEKFPTKQLMTRRENGADLLTVYNSVTITGVPVLLDGWGNPIIFVPASGLGRTPGAPGDPGTLQVGGTVITIKSPTNRPFFASAGADGDFSTGDDNIYSFEQ